ncbi:MAG TPA: HDOD domain-containing protein [Phycisphaerales bacterium]|nr:HDOD domain-containing protein [Phycisphaerales bacterium]
MRTRQDISAREVEDLHAHLERRLERVGVETQPEIAARVVELSCDPEAQLKDYLEMARLDWGLSGRLLRLANSAYYAQRSPVTRIERALVLLGLDRVKSICLGLYLAHRGADAGEREFARTVWGQSVFRACLGAALARARVPALAPEAFLVGLMLDVGVPLMPRLVGADYRQLAEGRSPAELYRDEQATLEFGHVDVAAALARRWRLPVALARPIVWHHSVPPLRQSQEPTLQHLAYYAGSVDLRPGAAPALPGPGPCGRRATGLEPERVADVLRSARGEYQALMEVFQDIAAPVDGGALRDAVHPQLVDVMDRQMARLMRTHACPAPERMFIAGHQIELEACGAGEVVAYITSANGQRLISCTVRAGKEHPVTIRRMLGLEEAADHEIQDLVNRISRLAA